MFMTSIDKLQTVANPDDLLVLVNKKRELPADYEPADLVDVDVPKVSRENKIPNVMMRKIAAKHLAQLYEKGNQEGLQLVALSGYRSYETQKSLFKKNVAKKGETQANQYCARPGQSEHQTGLAMDVTCSDVDNELVTHFGYTKEGKWIKQNAPEFGFIIRYLKGKESITGYQYEPWHLRYVGKEVAQKIASKEMTLEEYFGEI